jgi:hypothetical protein
VGVDPAEAERAVALMEEISDGLRGCAIVGPGNRPLAASGEAGLWAEAAGRLMGAARATRGGEPPAHVHVGTEDGEAFAVRHAGFALVAAAERFALAGLMLFDIRNVLRDLARAPGSAEPARAEAA